MIALKQPQIQKKIQKKWLKSPMAEATGRGGGVEKRAKKNHATSSILYWSYYPHRSRELMSPLCGILKPGVQPTTKELSAFFPGDFELLNY